MKAIILLSIVSVALAQYPFFCPYNSKWTDSGTACPVTCSNYGALVSSCVDIVVSYCACDEGYVRLVDFDYNNPSSYWSLCVPPSLCPNPTEPVPQPDPEPVPQPDPLCFANSKYTDSGTACPLTCNNYNSPPEACPAIAVAGCQCDEDYVRLFDFDLSNPTASPCVKPEQCPTTLPPLPPLCFANSKYTDSGTACPLTCNNYDSPPEACPAIAVSGCQCDDDYVRLFDFDLSNPTNSPCVKPEQCPTTLPPLPPLCPPNSEYTDSGTACPLTCNNYQTPPDTCPAIAVAGCQCLDPYVRLYDFDLNNPTFSLCVTTDQCPPPFPNFPPIVAVPPVA